MDLGANGSLFLSRPGLASYIADPAERAELMGHIEAGRIKIAVNHRYPRADAAKAHADLEGRRTTGSIVLTV